MKKIIREVAGAGGGGSRDGETSYSFSILEKKMSDRGALRDEFANFDTFWEAYPRKVAKIAASRTFTKAIQKTTLPVMLAAVAWQQTTKQWQQGIIPNASTWLHQERWKDEPPRPSTSTIPASEMWRFR